MIKVIGHDLWRGGQKIGWAEENHVFAHDGKKLGYFSENHVFDVTGRKLAYVEGDHLYADGSSRVSLETINENIVGGVLPEMAKCAIYVLLGD
ncbi:MAG: hypothetical protein KGI60_04505 [Patescibacteria group bacterium]|nr:hypothetical protein [Patescibacteria group bacterium]